MNTKVQEITQKIQSMILRYPLVLLISLVMAVSAIICIELNYKNQYPWVKIIIVSGLGISLLFALKMLSQRMKKGIWVELLGIVFLVGYYFLLPKKEDDFTEVFAYLLIPTFILSHLLVAFVAFIKKENSENHFWQFNKSLFVNFFLTLVFTGVLTSGVELAFLAVENLFNLDFKEEIYGQIAVFLLIFGSTVIFLLFNESGLEFLEKEGNYPVVLKFFTQYVLIPLLSIYVVILYFYSGKILINWELPRGWVSYLILAYSIVGILALLLVHPLKEEKAKSWVKIFSKVFYFTLIPLVVLLFVAIFTRVLEYGYTEPRYFVLLLAIWLMSVVLYFIFKKNPTIKFIPISLFSFGLFALVFPYFNSFSVAKRSQKNELEKILNENNLLVDGKIDFTKEVADTIVSEIDNKFDFLSERFQNEYLFQFLDKQTKKDFEDRKYWSFYSKFIHTKITPQSRPDDYYNVNLEASGTVDQIGEYQFMVMNQDVNFGKFKLQNDSVFLNFYQEKKDKRYILKLNGKDSVDLLPEIDKLFQKFKPSNSDGNLHEKLDPLFIEKDLGKYHFRIYFKNLNKSKYGNETPTYWFENQVILVKENP
ncbi:DUF4153 domain-containing protein [Moheibacter lacus]|uniref:DUF4153 domain-containing protein n=1 Tax=Moheibacter lacus TaxID=2745851 RepID=A0A838ZJT1_9FLAO|nr:DUF4153 domain-containing protein [Moheibacter lacus]MBA5628624.1 DUF4153 domain-containing protein [Moheibacter lacus]